MDNSIKHHFKISLDGDIRKVTLKSTSKVSDFIRRSIEVYDININIVAGIYFYFIDANVYIGDDEESSFERLIADFVEEYDITENNIFHIELINRSNRGQTLIDDFHMRFNIFNQNTTQAYYYRPTINITNNYGNSNITDEREGNYMWNNLRNFYRNNQRERRRENTTEGPADYRAYSWTFYPGNNAEGNTGSTYNQNDTRSGFGGAENIFTTLGRNLFSGNTSAYVNILNTSLNDILENYGRELITDADVDNLRRGRYQTLKNEGHILNDCTSCNITLEDFVNDTIVIALPCRHAFHESAIRYWLTHNSCRCPVCRRDVRI